MKAAEWIDRVKAVKGIGSDYGAAKALGLSRQTVSNYRSKTPTLDEDTAARIADALGVNLSGILIDQLAERCKSEKARSELREEAARIMQIVLSRRVPKSATQAAMMRRMASFEALH